MTLNKKIGWLICSAMAAASIAAYLLTPRVMLADTLPALNLETGIPTSFSQWDIDPSADVSIPNPELEDAIKSTYTNVLSRVYKNSDGKQISLSVAYGKNQSDGNALHYPEVCYPAQGYIISHKSISEIKIQNHPIQAKLLIATRGEHVEPITYWATVGQHIILSGTQHKIAQLRYGFDGLIPDGLIIRVSSIGSNSQIEYEIQRQFLDALIAALPLDVRSRVTGDSFEKQ